MVDFYKTFLFINYGLLLVIVFLIFWKYTILNKKEKQYAWYIVFLFIIELCSLVLPYVLKSYDTSFIYHFFIAGEFWILTGLFIRKLKINKLFYIISGLLSLGFLFVIYGLKVSFNYDLAKIISNLVIICLVATFLIQQIKNEKNIDRFILVDASIFFYYSVSVLIFVVLSQFVNLSTESVYLIMGVNNVLSTFLYCSIVYTFLKLKK
ncbi:hypothetical protein [Chryseobacterium sp. 5_R23647]|uniref:hypothetical protein n=1 Tax=Chryseobacterium sp. 5_R23647 TaxID=2258964 RepID=UPI000E2355D7|nr:hypothetical protein [Chryseobacterium sp. 5_R23647]REC40025.1 hypothetical protein DRF69_20535 [Chryseobacterium sp. 5_R23647]